MTGTTDRGRRGGACSAQQGFAGTALVATPAAARGDGRQREVTIQDGRAQPVFDGSNVIREDVWVETAFDTDGSGSPDRVHVEVARPADAGPDNQLPVVVQPSPYYGGLNQGSSHRMDEDLYVPPESDGSASAGTGDPVITSEDDLLEFTGTAADTIGPSAYESEFLPRGFAWAYAASIGTERSTGCPSIGGQTEIEGIETVVDWFNGRATAYDSRVGGSPVEATWTGGATGMLGVSYNGTLPNGVAATGVDGLETIVPIAAISSWYDYYRSNGAVIATGPGAGSAMDTDSLFDAIITRSNPAVCDASRQDLVDGQERLTGNRNDFWDERDYVHDADDVEAAVLAVHGLDDTNVKTRNVARWYDALTADDGDHPHRMWLMQAAHADPIQHHPEPWIDTLNVWLTHWLHKQGDAIDDIPTATVERSAGGLDTYDTWPHQNVERVDVTPLATADEPGTLTVQPTIGDPEPESFVDDPSVPTTSLVEAFDSPYTVVYRTEPLQSAIHVSGTIEPRLALASDEPAALVTVVLVEYDPSDDAHIVSRGWMNATNADSLYESAHISAELPGRRHLPDAGY